MLGHVQGTVGATLRSLPRGVAGDLHADPMAVAPTPPPTGARLDACLEDLCELPLPALGAAASEQLLVYRWPGTVREPDNAMQRALIFGNDGELGPEALCCAEQPGDRRASRSRP